MRVAPVAVEPMLRPSVRGGPGGSGFFYHRARCDVDTCANAMADAPAVTWSLIRQHTNTDTKYKGNRHAHNGNATAAATSATAAAAAVATDQDVETFSLEPMAAPGLTLAGVVSAGRSAVILTGAPDAVQPRLLFQARPAAGPSSSPFASSSSSASSVVFLVVTAGMSAFDKHMLCRDEATARDFPGPGGCADKNKKMCPGWAGGGAAAAATTRAHNQVFLLQLSLVIHTTTYY